MAKWLREYFGLGPHEAKGSAKVGAGGKKKARGESGSCRESDVMRAYRLQKERDFEDPYSQGPGSSLRRIRAMWDEVEDAAGPPLQRSQSERRAPSPRSKSIRPASRRLIKVHGPAAPDPPAGSSHGPAAPDPPAGSSHGPAAPDPPAGSSHGPAAPDPPAGSSHGPAAPDDKVAIREDYSDPFDVKNELKNKVIRKREIENNGYMEPYEAQKMMAEIHKQESQKKGIQLYDTPYEPGENGGASDTESVDSYPRESRLPQNDARPAEEYDQPWEWNKVSVPGFSVQLNGIEKRRSSPLCERHRQLMPPDLIKHGGLEFSEIVGERINPNTPLEKQVWYHGAISRTDAENLLRLCKECSYLIRNSQSSKNDYSLSLKSSQGFMHMKLTKTKDKYILGQKSLPFDSVPEVIHYYTTRKLPIKGAEHLSLLYPVPVRTL